MEKTVFWCFVITLVIVWLGLVFSLVMYAIIKKQSLKIYKKNKAHKKVKIAFRLLLLMGVFSVLVVIFIIYYMVENELGLEGIVKGLL